MNKDQVTGMIDEVAGIAKRKAGELTDNPKLQVKGMVQQAKGKVEGAWGKAFERETGPIIFRMLPAPTVGAGCAAPTQDLH